MEFYDRSPRVEGSHTHPVLEWNRSVAETGLEGEVFAGALFNSAFRSLQLGFFFGGGIEELGELGSGGL